MQRLRLLWDARTALGRAAAIGLLAGTLLAFFIPKRYESTTQLMPPDGQSNSGMAMLAALTGKAGGGLGSVAGDLLGVKNSGALFIGILGSSTVQDRLIARFDLKTVSYTHLDVYKRQAEERAGRRPDRLIGRVGRSGRNSVSTSRYDAKPGTLLQRRNFLNLSLIHIWKE